MVNILIMRIRKPVKRKNSFFEYVICSASWMRAYAVLVPHDNYICIYIAGHLSFNI